jgi:hypothetical protein
MSDELDKYYQTVDAFHALMGQFEQHITSIQTCSKGHKYIADSYEYPCPLCIRDKTINTLIIKLRAIQEACKILESAQLNDPLATEPPQPIPPQQRTPPAPPTKLTYNIDREDS